MKNCAICNTPNEMSAKFCTGCAAPFLPHTQVEPADYAFQQPAFTPTTQGYPVHAPYVPQPAVTDYPLNARGQIQIGGWLLAYLIGNFVAVGFSLLGTLLYLKAGINWVSLLVLFEAEDNLHAMYTVASLFASISSLIGFYGRSWNKVVSYLYTNSFLNMLFLAHTLLSGFGLLSYIMITIVLSCILWIIYLHRSKRVARTFHINMPPKSFSGWRERFRR